MEFVAEVSPSFTIGFVEEVREASRSLQTFADRGRIVPEVPHQKLREISVRDHRLIYRVEADEVTIVAIFHGRRDFRRAWGARAPPAPAWAVAGQLRVIFQAPDLAEAKKKFPVCSRICRRARGCWAPDDATAVAGWK